jgi:hypothetical protein
VAQVTKITVSAGRVFNHPFESYSNLQPHVTVEATPGLAEDWEEVTKQLQATAEKLVEDHKQHMLKSLAELERMQRRQAEAASLEKTIRKCQSDLDRLREEGGASLAMIADDQAEEDDDIEPMRGRSYDPDC